MLIPLVLSGCKAVEAPKNLEALMVYGFVNFDEEDPEYLQATARELVPLVKKYEEDLLDGYKVNDLTKADLASAGVESDRDVTAVIGSMGLVQYTHKVEPVAETVSSENKANMWPSKFLVYDVKKTSERSCFFTADEGDLCERLDQTIHERTDLGSLLGEADRTYDNSLRWLEPDDDLPEGVFVRTLSPDPVDTTSSIINVYQQYSFAFMWMEGGKARRVEAFWVDAEVVGASVPESTAVNLAVNAMGKQAQCVDEWLNGIKDSC